MKLSEHVPWYEQTRQAIWSRELAQEVEAHRERLDILEGKHKEQVPIECRLVNEALEAEREFAASCLEDAQTEAEMQEGYNKKLLRDCASLQQRIATLEAKPKQAPVDRRLVEEALQAAATLHTPLNVVAKVVQLLRRALEGDSDAQD